jgi:hypothetical protein
MERGILVSPQLQTARDNIWAAGDVCQIWSATSNAYRFYYGYRNVKMMGEVAAYNMTGEQSAFESTVDETLEVTSKGTLHSPFWELRLTWLSKPTSRSRSAASAGDWNHCRG